MSLCGAESAFVTRLARCYYFAAISCASVERLTHISYKIHTIHHFIKWLEKTVFIRSKALIIIHFCKHRDAIIDYYISVGVIYSLLHLLKEDKTKCIKYLGWKGNKLQEQYFINTLLMHMFDLKLCFVVLTHICWK